MEWDRIEGKWQHFKGNALRHWGKLTGDQLDASAGKLEQRFALVTAAALLGLAGCATSPGGTSFFDDAATTARVKKAIFNEPSLQVMNVSVTTEDGVVNLSGSVKSKAERSKASAVAIKVEGGKKVKNDLKVE